MSDSRIETKKRNAPGPRGAQGPPLFSVIVPVYNLEDYLRECVDSILAQTFGDFELIIVDDGSTDASPGIILEYAARDARIRPVITGVNRGAGPARDAGRALVRGGYVCFVDGDDTVAPDYLERSVELIEKFKADVILYDVMVRDFNGQTEPKVIRQKLRPGLIRPEDAIFHGFPTYWAKVMRRDVVAALPAIPKLTHDDVLVELAYGRHNRIVFDPAVMYTYRRLRSASMTSSFTGGCDSLAYVTGFELLLDAAKNSPLKEAHAYSVYNRRAYVTAPKHIDRLSPAERNRVIEFFVVLEGQLRAGGNRYLRAAERKARMRRLRKLAGRPFRALRRRFRRLFGLSDDSRSVGTAV